MKSEVISRKFFDFTKMTPTDFEEMVYLLFKYSNTLKENFHYETCDYIYGGRDLGRDSVIRSGTEIVGVIQCKHTDKKTMDRKVIKEEIIKFLLYLLTKPELLPNEKKKYIICISSKLTKDSLDVLINFEKEVIDSQDYIEQILKCIKKYKSSLSELNTSNNILLKEKTREIYKKLEVHYLMEIDLIMALKEESFSIKSIYEKYFKTDFESKFSIPNLSEELILENKKEELKLKRFYNKIVEIELDDFFLEDAISSYYKKSIVTMKMTSENTNHLLENIKEYSEEILNSEKYNRTHYSLKNNINSIQSKDEILNLSKLYYLECIESIKNKKNIKGFEYVPDYYPKGTVHELVNCYKIDSWLLKCLKEK